MSNHRPLTTAFLASALSAKAAELTAELGPPATEALEHCLQDMYDQGQRIWPELLIAAPAFATYLGARLQPGAELSEPALRKLSAADLYLVCGCLLNQPAALEGLERSVMSRVPAFLATLNLPADEVKEVRQLLWTKLVVGAPDRPPTLLEYAGRGALGSWARVVAVRTALDHLRTREVQAQTSSRATALKLLAPTPDPELEHIKQTYQQDFQRALEDAITTLSDWQRNLLHMYFAGSVKTAQLAALFQVNQSTIVRQLAQARAAIQDEMRRLLRERLQLRASDYESLLRLLQSQLDLSMQVLGEDPAA